MASASRRGSSVTAINEPGTLAEIAEVIADNDANISQSVDDAARRPDFTEMLIDLEVWDLKHLTRHASASLQAKPSRRQGRARQRLSRTESREIAWTRDEVLDDLPRGAARSSKGHFILTSGLRSPVFLQKARVFMHADKTETAVQGAGRKIRADVPGKIDYVVGPAVGGIIPAYETSRHLGVPAIWVEREDGVFRLRRFEIEQGARVVIVEDIVTTGLSIRETVECLERTRRRGRRRRLPHRPLGRQGRCRRAAGRAGANTRFRPMPADQLPPELAAIPADQARQPAHLAQYGVNRHIGLQHALSLAQCG